MTTRRQFLQATVAGAGVLAFPTLAFPFTKEHERLVLLEQITEVISTNEWPDTLLVVVASMWHTHHDGSNSYSYATFPMKLTTAEDVLYVYENGLLQNKQYQWVFSKFKHPELNKLMPEKIYA